MLEYGLMAPAMFAGLVIFMLIGFPVTFSLSALGLTPTPGGGFQVDRAALERAFRTDPAGVLALVMSPPGQNEPAGQSRQRPDATSL